MLHLCAYLVKTWNHFHFIDFNINFISLYAHWCSWCTIFPVSHVAPWEDYVPTSAHSFQVGQISLFGGLVLFPRPYVWHPWFKLKYLNVLNGLPNYQFGEKCYFSNSFHILSINHLGSIAVLICSNWDVWVGKVGTTRPQAWPHDDVIIRQTPN